VNNKVLADRSYGAEGKYFFSLAQYDFDTGVQKTLFEAPLGV
jgi:hypothetical protein